MVERIVEVIREVPVYVQERAFDPATAPGTVSLSVRMPDGTPPTVSVFASFVGVGGKTFGGPLDKDGAITVTMPQGRYYTEFLVVDTRYGPPNDPPSFFLDANEEQTFGPLLLSHTSSFTDTALEAEVEKRSPKKRAAWRKSSPSSSNCSSPFSAKSAVCAPSSSPSATRPILCNQHTKSGLRDVFPDLVFVITSLSHREENT